MASSATSVAGTTQDATADACNKQMGLILALAAIVRIVIALASIGSNDTLLWHQFGREVWAGPLGNVWRIDPRMNNPLLPALYAGAIYAFTGERLYAFSLLFKLPGIAADVLATGLIGRIVLARTGSIQVGRWAAIAYALNPTAILISGYHGNIDALLALLSLVAWWLASRGKFGWAGLAAGAAVNVKVSAAPAAILLLVCARSRAEFRRALLALIFSAVPFAVAWFAVGPIFFEQVFRYRPPGGYWLLWPIDELARHGVATDLITGISRLHASTVVQIVLLMAIVIAGWWHRRGQRRLDPLEVGALFWVMMLCWIGGSLQYSIWPLPLLAATRPAIALAYGVGASVWLLWSYVEVLGAGWPLRSVFPDPLTQSRFAIVLPLMMLGIAMVSLVRSPHRPREVSTPAC